MKEKILYGIEMTMNKITEVIKLTAFSLRFFLIKEKEMI